VSLLKNSLFRKNNLILSINTSRKSYQNSHLKRILTKQTTEKRNKNQRWKGETKSPAQKHNNN
jgi:hypothetical protein